MRLVHSINDEESDECNQIQIGARNGRKRMRIDAELDKEGKKCQREAQDAIFKGQQLRLPYADISSMELSRQKKNFMGRQKTVEKMHMKNFYAIDTETTGFDHNHPIQIAAILFIDGNPRATINQYLMTAIEIQPSAYGIHGLSKEKLKDLGANAWSKGCSDVLANFLNVHPNFPIVAHNVEYDLDTVLRPAFERVGNMARLPKPERWVCT